METRFNRMSQDDQTHYHELMNRLEEKSHDSDELFHQIGQLMGKIEKFSFYLIR